MFKLGIGRIPRPWRPTSRLTPSIGPSYRNCPTKKIRKGRDKIEKVLICQYFLAYLVLFHHFLALVTSEKPPIRCKNRCLLEPVHSFYRVESLEFSVNADLKNYIGVLDQIKADIPKVLANARNFQAVPYDKELSE